MRTVLAVLAGLLVGGVTIAALEAAGHALFPLPAGTDPANLRPADIPASAMVAVLVAWAAGAFVGGLRAAAIATPLAAIVVGGIQTLGGLVNMMAIPSPIWFWVVGLLIFVPCAMLGARVAPRRHRHA